MFSSSGSLVGVGGAARCELLRRRQQRSDQRIDLHRSAGRRIHGTGHHGHGRDGPGSFVRLEWNDVEGIETKFMRQPRKAVRRQSGFTLLEAMISILILSFGVLSLAAVYCQGILYASFAQYDYIAEKKAEQAVEAIFTARDIKSLSWTNLQNVSQGGVFVDGPSRILLPGADGLVGTVNDVGSPDEVVITGPTTTTRFESLDEAHHRHLTGQHWREPGDTGTQFAADYCNHAIHGWRPNAHLYADQLYLVVCLRWCLRWCLSQWCLRWSSSELATRTEGTEEWL